MIMLLIQRPRGTIAGGMSKPKNRCVPRLGLSSTPKGETAGTQTGSLAPAVSPCLVMPDLIRHP
jgi:hypothetical protein